MFKTLVKWLIEALEFLSSELRRAYEETYELSDLAREFRETVCEIKKANKEMFIKAAERFERGKSMMSLEYADTKEIKKRALKRWRTALEDGVLDELYNFKGEL